MISGGMNTFSESEGGGLKLSSEPKGPGAKLTLGPDSGLGLDQTKLQADNSKTMIVNIFLASKRSGDDSCNLRLDSIAPNDLRGNLKCTRW